VNQSLSVLVVDDDFLCRETTMQQLRNAGYCAGCAEDAFVALTRLQQSLWDVVVTDLRMPRMDGLELRGKIRESWPDVSVIIMTADIATLRESGAGVLTKPFSFGELDLRLKELAGHRQPRPAEHGQDHSTQQTSLNKVAAESRSRSADKRL
jgi:DNA-binding response OmpR family regulator